MFSFLCTLFNLCVPKSVSFQDALFGHLKTLYSILRRNISLIILYASKHEKIGDNWKKRCCHIRFFFKKLTILFAFEWRNMWMSAIVLSLTNYYLLFIHLLGFCRIWSVVQPITTTRQLINNCKCSNFNNNCKRSKNNKMLRNTANQI